MDRLSSVKEAAVSSVTEAYSAGVQTADELTRRAWLALWTRTSSSRPKASLPRWGKASDAGTASSAAAQVTTWELPSPPPSPPLSRAGTIAQKIKQLEQELESLQLTSTVERERASKLAIELGDERSAAVAAIKQAELERSAATLALRETEMAAAEARAESEAQIAAERTAAENLRAMLERESIRLTEECAAVSKQLLEAEAAVAGREAKAMQLAAENERLATAADEAKQKWDEELAAVRAAAEDSDDGCCVMCLDTQREIAMLPCGHLILCSDCTDEAKDVAADGGEAFICMVCRQPVTDTVKVYKS